MTTANDQQTPVPRTGRRRRWVSLMLWSFGGMILLLVIAGFIVTRPSVFTGIFAGGIGDRLDADVQIEDGTWDGWSSFTLKNISIQAHDLAGPPGKIAAIDSLHVDVNMSGLFGFGSVLDRIEVGPASLRIAEHAQDANQLNVGRLFSDRSPSREQESIPELPRSILLDSLRVEVGTYEGDQWFPRSEVVLEGKAEPDPARPESYDIELRTLSGAKEAIEITGKFDPNLPSVGLVLSEGSMDDSVIALLPSSIREWSRRLDLSGSAKNISIDWEANRLLTVSLDLEGVRMTLPPELLPADFWSRYRNQGHEPSPDSPRMVVSSGKVLFQGGLLSFRDLKGHFTSDSEEELADVPFVFNFAFHDMSGDLLQYDDLAERLRLLPFTMSLRTDDFVIGTEPGQATQADLPKIVAQILSMFRVITCTVATQIDATRAAPEGDMAKPINFEGQLKISDASGAYERFSYPLSNLDALVGFEIESGDTSVHVLSLNANGSGESTIRIVGDVIPSSDGSEVDMKLTASKLPLDRNLIDAMPSDTAQTMRSLFARHGADLFATKERVQEAHEIVELNLQILRDPGPNRPTRLQGMIDFEEMHLTWDTFPYPISLAAGRIHWIGDTLKLENAEGGPLLEMETSAGGFGTVGGFIRVPLDDQAPSGKLDFNIGSQRITPEFTKALAHVAPEVAGLITALDLKGDVLMTGPVEVDGLGNTSWDLLIELTSGTSAPRDNLARYLGTSQAFWSRGIELDSISALIVTDQDKISVRSCTASAGDMTLDVEGMVHLVNPLLTDIGVRVDGVPVQERLIRLTSGSLRETIESLWARWQPAGKIGLDARVRGTGPDGRTEVRIDALNLRLNTDEAVEELQLTGGSCTVGSDFISLEEVVVETTAGSIPDGTYLVRGDARWDEEGTDAQLVCELEEGRFESPFLHSLLDAFIANDTVSDLKSMNPSGTFDATAMIERSPGEQPQWSLDLQPRALSLLLNETVFNLSFDRGGLSVVRNVYSLKDLSGTMDGGAFRVAGDVSMASAMNGTLHFDFDGKIDAPDVVALLPRGAADAIRSLEYKDGIETSVRGGLLRFGSAADGADEVEFDAAFHVDGASLNIGRRISEIKGMAEIHVLDTDGRALQFDVEGDFDSMEMYGQTVERTEFAMRLEQGEVLNVSRFSGDIADGELFGVGTYDLGESKQWSVQLQIADAALHEFVAPASSDDEGEESEPAAGRVYASVNLEGVTDGIDRIGAGRIRIYEGSFKRLPLSVGIYQLLQLSSPIVSPPEFLDVVWNIENDDIALDSILIQSLQNDDVLFSLKGSGTFDWETQSVSAVLRPRSSWALGDMLGILHDRIYAISVEGPVADPEVGMIPFPDMQ